MYLENQLPLDGEKSCKVLTIVSLLIYVSLPSNNSRLSPQIVSDLLVTSVSQEVLDLLQGDLLPFLAPKRPTASDEVARGRLVSLAGFSFAFRAKNGE